MKADKIRKTDEDKKEGIKKRSGKEAPHYVLKISI